MMVILVESVEETRQVKVYMGRRGRQLINNYRFVMISLQRCTVSEWLGETQNKQNIHVRLWEKE